MPKLRHVVPKYCRHKARNLAYVRIAGQDIYLGKWRSEESRRLYELIVAEYLKSGRTLDLREINSSHDSAALAKAEEVLPAITVSELIDQYLEAAKTHYVKNGRPTSELTNTRIALELARKEFADLPVDQFGARCLEKIRDAMLSRKKKWMRKTINGHCQRIKRAFKWGLERELFVATSKYQSLVAVRGLAAGRSIAKESKPVAAVSDDVVEKTLAKLPAVVADMVRLQRLTGCRPGELFNMRPRDIDRSGEIWIFRPAVHKTEHHDKDRVIPIGPKSQAILSPYLLRAKGSYCFSPAESEKKRLEELHEQRKTPLSCGNRPGTNVKEKPKSAPGKCYRKDSFNQAIRRACERAGVPKWTPNQLRHAAATEIRKEYGLDAAQVVLGHANANVTQVYAERHLQLAVDVAKKLG